MGWAVLDHQKPAPTGQLGDCIGKPTGIGRPVRHSLMDSSTANKPEHRPPSHSAKNELNADHGEGRGPAHVPGWPPVGAISRLCRLRLTRTWSLKLGFTRKRNCGSLTVRVTLASVVLRFKFWAITSCSNSFLLCRAPASKSAAHKRQKETATEHLPRKKEQCRERTVTERQAEHNAKVTQ